MTKRESVSIGKHCICDIYNIDATLLHDVKFLDRICVGGVESGKATIVKKGVHKFSPYGLTGFYVLSESHLSYHTYPEHNMIMVDAFTCGDTASPLEIIKHIIAEIENSQQTKVKVDMKYLDRGKI